eukprot:SAG31_NODE_1164_length_9581_cov_16.106623_2_plen_723_part_00
MVAVQTVPMARTLSRTVGIKSLSMRRGSTILCALLMVAALIMSQPAQARSAGRSLQLYVYAEGNLRNRSFLPVLMNWTRRAKACGYDGMFYADSDLQALHLGPPASSSGCEWCALGSAKDFLNGLKAWQVQAKALQFDLMPLVFPFGPSDPILLQPEPTEPNGSIHNLVEPISFRDTEFIVGHNGELELQDSMAKALNNANFDPPADGDQFDHWVQDLPGNRTFVDREVRRGGRGASLRIGPGAGDGMAMQTLTVPSFRLAKVSFWAKTKNFSAIQYNVEVRTLDVDAHASCQLARGDNRNANGLTVSRENCAVRMQMGRRLSWWPLVLNSTQDWTQYMYTTPTWSESCGIFLGIEDRGTPQSGNIWFDDVKVEEIALLNVVRRQGAPVSAKLATSGGKLVEGRDISRVEDPFWQRFRYNNATDSPNLHAMPKLRVLSGSKLQPGDKILLSYYALVPVYQGTAASCLTHPAITDYMQQNMRALGSSNGGFPGYLMSYDEMRTGNTCEICAGHGGTAGELLASHLTNATRIAEEMVGKDKPLWICEKMCFFFFACIPRLYTMFCYLKSGSSSGDDMFNPYHNAHDDYFLINGTVAGSWEGIPPQVQVMNWGPPISCKCGGFGSPVYHHELPPGTCPCHISRPTPGGSSGTTTDYAAGLRFFAHRGLRQTFAGYYDSRNGSGSAALEVELARGIPNITGWMYTTWNNEYDNMCDYSATIRRLRP